MATDKARPILKYVHCYLASRAVKMVKWRVRMLCAALGLGDVVFNKQNNLRHETQPLFPVYSNGQFRSMSRKCQLFV